MESELKGGCYDGGAAFFNRSSLLLGRVNEQYTDSFNRTPFCKCIGYMVQWIEHVTCEQSRDHQVACLNWLRGFAPFQPAHGPPSGSCSVFAEPALALSSSFLITYGLQRFCAVTFSKQGENWSTWVCRGERQKKSLSLTARATEQEKALAWRVSNALPRHDEIYCTERGADKWWADLCVSVFGGGVCVRVIFFWRVERVTVTATVPFSFTC